MGNLIESELIIYRNETRNELAGILDYWSRHATDNSAGGFYGRVDDNGNAFPNAPKGSVLNSRILWTFSAAYNHTQRPEYLVLASRAYNYIDRHFMDHEFGGVYWTTDATGNPLETKKQVYAAAFTLYGYAEYQRSSGDATVLGAAKTLYETIVRNAYDPVAGGFFEAFTRDWKALPDQRLSAKDANTKKSMNTNLHVLEAFANLYTIWPDAGLRSQIASLLDIFSEKIIDNFSGHMNLFFDDNWTVVPDVISYGHDIEASWLLLEAAMVINDDPLIGRFRKASINLATAALRGLDSDGGLWYEYDPSKNETVKQKHWWPQAEAMVGFLNAWQVSADVTFLNHSINTWNFIKEKIIDKKNGEWFWGINAEGDPMPGQDKVGLWKCPYHNARACLEVIRRVGTII